MLGLALVGCSKGSAGSSSTQSKNTALDGLKLAQSAVSTMAPDAKLLLVQNGQVMTATSTPVWDYILGSPKTDKLYAVVVQGGVPQAQEYGTANLGTEWPNVPAVDVIKIDSNEALAKAKTVYPNAKDDTMYAMGLITYIPKSGNSQAKAMTWYVQFDPSTQGKLATATVEVNATTGAAALAK